MLLLFLWLAFLFTFWLLAKLVVKPLVNIPKKISNKIVILVLCLSVVLAVPVWDIPIIVSEFEQQCKAEAGIHVYEEIFLGPEYWKEDGTLTFLPAPNLRSVIPGGLEVIHSSDRNFSSITKIKKSRIQIKRTIDQKIIGEKIRIKHGRGWWGKRIREQAWGTCPEYFSVSSVENEVSYNQLAKAIFKPKPVK